MLSIAIEPFIKNIEEIKSLNIQHYEEISEHYKHGIDLEPQYDKYEVRENNGELLYLTLRDDGKLIGYYIGFIGAALHYKSCLQAQMDIIYVEPSSRGQRGGMMLGNAIIAEHKRRGVQLMTMGFKEAHRIYMQKLLEQMGMRPFEVTYGLWLND
jgi:GNAT superfamily N-acetyltransferase